ncbi:hypothetical protein niasHS_009105 [Heterodera schachtii]|uniref:DNA-directed DNA polymerase n=1 Tax=Heterodera schachtii TaxID=97005 RepID=A0ABD2J235_HETSC
MSNSTPSSPPSKRSRRFFIDELLREPYNELSNPRKSPKDYVKKLDSGIERVPKFQWLKNKSSFIIEDVPADPEGLLIGIFQHCMDEAMSESVLGGIKPTHLGCIVSSQLLTSDIWIPIRQITPDTINTILNRFNDVAQSKKQDGVTLWGQPFNVTVTTVNRKGLPEKRQLKGGAPRKLAPANHQIHEQCLIKPNQKKEATGWRLVTFDLETMQHAPADPNFPERRKHQVNFVTAKVACPDCISSGKWKESLRGKFCNVCGYHRTITFSQMPFNTTTVDRQTIDRHPLVAFVKWILYKLPKQYETIAYSHFGGRFDMVLVFKELLMEGLNPSMIKKGNRLFEMKVKSRKKMNPNVTFRDSWNLIPGPLASMVPMFGLDVQDKPFFPHLANRPENYGCQIFPSKSDYLADGMNLEKRKEFDTWYQQNRNTPFLLDEALASYCKNDVDILMAGLIAFRLEFLEMTKRPAGSDGKADRAAFKTPHEGIDPIRHCITIASACMRHFRTNHLKPAHLALVPEKGYDSCGDNQSDLALNFMQWYADKYGVHIQNAFSAEGEKR